MSGLLEDILIPPESIWQPAPTEVEESDQIVRAARDRKLQSLLFSFCSMRPLRRQALLLGYAAMDEDHIAAGVRTLSHVVEHGLTHQRHNLRWEAEA